MHPADEADTVERAETREFYRNSASAISIYSFCSMECIKHSIQIKDLLFLFPIKPSLRKSFNRITEKMIKRLS